MSDDGNSQESDGCFWEFVGCLAPTIILGLTLLLVQGIENFFHRYLDLGFLNWIIGLISAALIAGSILKWLESR